MVCRRIKNNRGAVLVFVAVSLVVLLGMAALVVDLGRLFLGRQRAQHVADAAAIGAAWVLNGDSDSETPAIDEAQALADANNGTTPGWIVRNLSNSPGVTATVLPDGEEITLADGSTMTVGPYSAIQIDCGVNVAYRFAPVLGKTDGTPHASAIAMRTAIRSWSSRLVPVGLYDDYLEGKVAGDYIEAAIKQNLSSGNFGAVILPGDDVLKATYESRLAGTAAQLSVDLQDIVEVDNRHGNITKPTSDGLAARIGDDTTTWDEWVAAGMPDDCPRIVIMPVLSSSSDSTNQSFDVVGFIGFFIERWEPLNGGGNVDPRIYGRFISGTTSGGVTHWDLYSGEQGSNPMEEIRLVK